MSLWPILLPPLPPPAILQRGLSGKGIQIQGGSEGAPPEQGARILLASQEQEHKVRYHSCLFSSEVARTGFTSGLMVSTFNNRLDKVTPESPARLRQRKEQDLLREKWVSG